MKSAVAERHLTREGDIEVMAGSGRGIVAVGVGERGKG